MCLIIACEPTRKLPKATFHAAIKSAVKFNPDGIGLTWAENGVAMILKSVDNYDPVIKKALEIYSKTSAPLAVHLRYNTAGKNSMTNTHPFAISDRLAMVHNKTLDIEPPNRHWSDTRTVAELLVRLCEADPFFFDSELFNSFIEHHAGEENRFVFLDGQLEQLVYVNKYLGKSVDGVWFSNLYAWDYRTVGISLTGKNGKRKKDRFANPDEAYADCSEFYGWDGDDMPLAWGSDRVDKRFVESF